jgi:hypothetical protein
MLVRVLQDQQLTMRGEWSVEPTQAMRPRAEARVAGRPRRATWVGWYASQ